jgi:succinate-semialdehyde dehydrogenase/glutarate-semialdehyde dehydrogenase
MLVAKASKLKIGNGIDKDTILGPLTTEKRLQEIETLVETTKKEGAKVLCGGRRPAGFNKGYFYEPTIFDDIKDDFTIMSQEPFGPLVPILTFKDTEEVVKRANDNDLGLASYVYTNSLERAHNGNRYMRS